MTVSTEHSAPPPRGRRGRARSSAQPDPLAVSALLASPPPQPRDPDVGPAPALPIEVESGPGFTSGTASESTPVTHGGRTYRVRKGDDLVSVAARFGVSVPALIDLNGLARRPHLRPGQIVSLPERQIADGPATDRARPGDTLESIAARHRVRPADLQHANAMGDSRLIVEGELLSLTGTGAMSARPRVEALDLPQLTASTDGYPEATVQAARINRRSLLARRIPSRAAVRTLVARTAQDHGLDRFLAAAVAQVESGFHHGVVSPGNAIGVMQVTPHAGHCASHAIGRPLDVLDAADNVLAGVVIVSTLLERAGDESEALAAYYQGLTSVRTHGAHRDARMFAATVQIIADRTRAEESR